MKYLITLSLLLAFFQVSAQYAPEFDVRGTDDTNDGAELQLATPSESNFLRFFSGRTGDPSPHLYFSDQDTFRIASGKEDFSKFSERLGILPNGSIRIGALAEMGERQVTVDSTGILKVGSPVSTSFSAALPADTSFANALELTIDNWFEVHDDGGHFDPATGVYTIPEDGVYQFKVKLSWRWESVDLDDVPIITRFRVNGNIAPIGQSTDRVTIRSNYGEDTSFSMLSKFQAGDQISVTALVITGGPTIELHGNLGANSTSLSGFRID